MDIMLIGKGRSLTLDANRLHDTIAIHSYASIISSARTETDWLIASLATASTVFKGGTAYRVGQCAVQLMGQAGTMLEHIELILVFWLPIGFKPVNFMTSAGTGSDSCGFAVLEQE